VTYIGRFVLCDRPGDGYVKPFAISPYASSSIEHKLDITRDSLSSSRHNREMIEADRRYRELTRTSGQWYTETKRDIQEGERKWSRMSSKQDRYNTTRKTGNFLGTGGGLRDYDGGLELGIGWHGSPFKYDDEAARKINAEKRAMDALLPKMISSMDIVKDIRLAQLVAAKEKKYEDHYHGTWLDARIGASEHSGRKDADRRCDMAPLSVLNAGRTAQVIHAEEIRSQEIGRVVRQHGIEIDARAQREAVMEEERQMDKIQAQIQDARDTIVLEGQCALESSTAARRSMHEAAVKDALKRIPVLQKKYEILAHDTAMKDMQARSIEDAAKRSQYTPLTTRSHIGTEHLQSLEGLDTAARFIVELERLNKEVDNLVVKIDLDNDGNLTREEYHEAYSKDIQLFNLLARVYASAGNLQRQIDHSLAVSKHVASKANLERQHEASHKCAVLLERINSMRQMPM